MNEQIKNGGPAFPADQHAVAGMTLRDYFAAKAMQGFCTRPPEDFADMRMVAEQAYELADAMLAEREGGKEESQPSLAEISSDIKQANLNRLADKVLALNGTRVGGIGQFWPAGQNHGGGAMIPVCWRELNELVALAKELKQ